MIKRIFLISLLGLECAFAQTYTPQISRGEDLTEQEKIILSTLWLKSGHKQEWQEKTPDEVVIKPDEKPIPTPAPTPTEKPMSAGQKKIQEMMAANKARIKAMREQEKRDEAAQPNRPETLQEKVANNLKKNREKVQATRQGWIEQRNRTWEKWKMARDHFLKKELPIVKEQTFNLGEGAPYSSKKKLMKPLKVFPKDDVILIKGSLNLPVRTQGQRPTCAAFSAIRAIESILVSNGQNIDLSEQYFYYASKPDCQRSPCLTKGSWVNQSIDQSFKSTKADIPLEKNCPYNPLPKPGNETQIPLMNQCHQGAVKISNYTKIESMNEIVNSLQKGYPIIAGFKLSPNFYETEGLVTLSDSNLSGQTDAHAGGHALVLLGLMKLPADLYRSEGRYCFIASNSWGEGYGVGGYSCLTEKWVQRYRVRNPFIAISSVQKDRI